VGARGVGLRAGRRRRAMADTLVMRPRRRTAPTLRDLSGVRGDRLFERDWVRSASYFSRQAAKPQRPRLSRPRRGHPGRRHWRGTPSPALRHGERRRHPRALGAFAPLRETNDADTTTPRSKSRSPPHPDRSRRAAEPQSAHLKRDRRRHPRPLCGSAPLRETNNAATPRQVAPSRKPPRALPVGVLARPSAPPRLAIEAPPPDQRPRIPHPQLFSPPLLRPIAA
jgi:hypothetical protein